MTIPSNVTILNEGNGHVRIFRQAIMISLEKDGVDISTIDPVASAMRYAQMWSDEMKRRYPLTEWKFQVEPGDVPTLVVINPPNHPRMPAIMEDLVRVGHDVFGQWARWVIQKGDEQSTVIRGAFAEVVRDGA